MIPTKCPLCHKSALYYDDEEMVYCTNCRKYKEAVKLYLRPLTWASKKSWLVRLPVFIWFGYLMIIVQKQPDYALNRLSNPLSALNFGIHELGHKIFIVFGEFWTILGGSVFQCLFPVICFLAFLKQKWYFAAAMCWCWLGLNLYDVAYYVADARSRNIPLSIGLAIFGVDPNNTDAAYDQAHDWYQILSRTNRLELDSVYANYLRTAGRVAFIIGLTLGLVLIIQMIISSIQKRFNK